MALKKLPKHQQGLLSVIVPAYSCKTIARDLSTLKNYLVDTGYPYEIICVVDGLKNKTDKTFQLAKTQSDSRTKILFYHTNKGKGYAIRFGMARARGGLIAFIDAGSDLNAKGLGLALENMRWHKADIVIGSKRHPDSKVTYPLKRKILSFFVQQATRLFFGLNVSDTQTGLKVFRRQVLVKVLPRLIVKRWAFDLEILTVANRLGFRKIFESPVDINYNFASTIGVKAVLNFITDYLAIFYRTYILHYYDDSKNDLWAHDSKLKLRYS